MPKIIKNNTTYDYEDRVSLSYNDLVDVPTVNGIELKGGLKCSDLINVKGDIVKDNDYIAHKTMLTNSDLQGFGFYKLDFDEYGHITKATPWHIYYQTEVPEDSLGSNGDVCFVKK